MSARLRQAFLIEAGLVAALFLASAWWATSYWNASIAGGREPLFYQEYFEPAVMMACGKGFVVSATQPKPLEDWFFHFKWLSALTVYFQVCLRHGRPNQSSWHYNIM